MNSQLVLIMRDGLVAAFTSAIVVAMVVTTANARPSTQRYSCEGVRDLIEDRGSVVMDLKPGVYRRFVNNRQECELDQITERFYVPTTTGLCSLKICRSRAAPLGR